MKLAILTGGIATGKSTVSKIISDLGWAVIDTDLIAREVVAPGSRGLKAVIDRFGSTLLTKDGNLDRKALGAIIFNDPAARRDLDHLLHPLIMDTVAQRLKVAWMSGYSACVVDIPLYYECGFHLRGGLRGLPTIVVAVEPEEQLRRLQARDNCPETDARARIASQLPIGEKVALADVVVDNNGGLEELQYNVEDALGEIRAENPHTIAQWVLMGHPLTRFAQFTGAVGAFCAVLALSAILVKKFTK